MSAGKNYYIHVDGWLYTGQSPLSKFPENGSYTLSVSFDECKSKTAKCAAGASCVDTVQGYTCQCPSGYELGNDNQTCTDINECAAQDKGGCSQLCINTKGGYSCECVAGYTLATDDKTCVKNGTALHFCDGVGMCGKTNANLVIANGKLKYCHCDVLCKKYGDCCSASGKALATTCKGAKCVNCQ